MSWPGSGPVVDGLPTTVATHQLQVERGTGKVCRPKTDVLPLCHATNRYIVALSPVRERSIVMGISVCLSAHNISIM